MIAKSSVQTFSFSLEGEAPRLEDNLGLAYRVALRFVHDRKRVVDSEEYSDALFGLYQATKGFTQGRERFSTYATRCCNNAVIDGRRKRRDYEPLEDEHPAREDRLPVDLVEIFLEDHPEDTQRDRENKEILKKHFINHESWEDIGTEMGVTRSAVFQRAEMAIRMIRIRYKEVIESIL